MARWLETLDTYTFTILHRPGKLHGNADALSRGPCAQCSLDHEGEKIHRGRRKREEVTKVQTRSKTKTHPEQEDSSPHSNWMEGASLEPEKIRAAQMGNPVLSEVWGWVKAQKKPEYGEIFVGTV